MLGRLDGKTVVVPIPLASFKGPMIPFPQVKRLYEESIDKLLRYVYITEGTREMSFNPC